MFSVAGGNWRRYQRPAVENFGKNAEVSRRLRTAQEVRRGRRRAIDLGLQAQGATRLSLQFTSVLPGSKG